MGIFRKLYKVGGDAFSSKQVKKAVAGQRKNIKDFANRGIKSTPAIGVQGATKATSGGFKSSSIDAAKGVAKGLGKTSKIGGRVLGYSAIAAVPALTGLKVYGDYKEEKALTDADRRFKFIMQTQADLNPDNFTSGNPLVDADPTNMGNTGIGSPLSTSPAYDIAYGQSGAKTSEDLGSSSGGMFGLGTIGLAAAGIGAYYLMKKKKSKN